MFENIIKTIINDLEEKERDIDEPLFSNPAYTTQPINTKNFVNIKNKQNNSTVCFVDGGNAQIISTNNFDLSYIKTCIVKYKDNKRLSHILNEFYCFSKIKKIDEKIFYSTKIFQIEGNQIIQDDEILIDSMDESIRQGKFRASIKVVPGMVRKLAENKIIISLINELSKDDIIIKDGTLEFFSEAEEKIAPQIINNEKQVIIAAIAKTTGLLTKNGNNLLAYLNNIGPKEKWSYPIATVNLKKHTAEIHGVKLNDKSKYVFRFETTRDASKVLSSLAINSNDSAFIGYPFGLIMADLFARVQNNDVNRIKTTFMTKFKNHWQKIERYQNTQNAHNILDSIY